MRRVMDIVFDLLVFIVMITCCFPIFIQCYSYLLYNQSFGFNTLSEKSIIATDYQMRDVEKLGYFSKIQVLLTPAVDDTYIGTRTVLFDGTAIVYTLTDISTSRGQALESVLASTGFNATSDSEKNIN